MCVWGWLDELEAARGMREMLDQRRSADSEVAQPDPLPTPSTRSYRAALALHCRGYGPHVVIMVLFNGMTCMKTGCFVDDAQSQRRALGAERGLRRIVARLGHL